MARQRSIYPFLYWSKRRELLRYARRLEKQGFKIDYSTFPKELKRPNKYSWKRIESWTHEDVQLRATKVVDGKTLTYKEAMHEIRSQASKKGWVTRRNKDFQADFPLDEDIFIPGNIPFDQKYYPDEGKISFTNAAKILGAPDEFIEECLDAIDNCFSDPLFGERNIKWVSESTTYGELLTNYLRQLLSDEEKTKKVVENVVNASADDDIFRLIGLMMFADSDSPDPPHVSFQNITRIFEGLSYSIPSASEMEEWEDGFD